MQKDEKMAVHYFRLAAERGHVDSQYNLGVCYQHGLGVQKCQNTALRYYQKAALRGDPDAQEMCIKCLLHG